MKTFKIAFVLPNGIELFYAYRSGIPYLTKKVGAAFCFDCEYYPTQKTQENEGDRLKKYFFDDLNIISKVVR